MLDRKAQECHLRDLALFAGRTCHEFAQAFGGHPQDATARNAIQVLGAGLDEQAIFKVQATERSAQPLSDLLVEAQTIGERERTVDFEPN
jgi:hypothetical protein